MKGRIIIPILVTVFGITAVCWLSGVFAMSLIDVPSFIIAPVLPFLYMAGSYGFRGIGKAYRSAVKQHSAGETDSLAEMRMARSFFHELERANWLFAISAFFIGLMGIFA
ncbi:MAG: hypothetical protein LBR47_05150, partial [Spirochaetaceae bacterium]|nr:hypothetical protein [Spirochaetaceae bacterium]